MDVTDDGRAISVSTGTLLDVLRRHASAGGVVDLAGLLSDGVEVRAQRPELERLRRQRLVLLEFQEDHIARITLLSRALRASVPSGF